MSRKFRRLRSASFLEKIRGSREARDEKYPSPYFSGLSLIEENAERVQGIEFIGVRIVDKIYEARGYGLSGGWYLHGK